MNLSSTFLVFFLVRLEHNSTCCIGGSAEESIICDSSKYSGCISKELVVGLG